MLFSKISDNMVNSTQKIIISLFIISIIVSPSYSYSQVFQKSKSNIETTLNRLSESIRDDHKYDTTYENMLKGIELVYEKPDFVYPKISFIRTVADNYIYSEIKDTSIVLLTDKNRYILSDDYWIKTFGNWYVAPTKAIKRMVSFIEKKEIVIALYSLPNTHTDIVVFLKKNGILYPRFIYPGVESGSLYETYPKIMEVRGDTIKIGYTSGDGSDSWGNNSDYLINKNKCQILRNEYYSGWISSEKPAYEARRIYKTYYNSEGKVERKEFDCFGRYEDGTFLYEKTKTDSVTLFYIDPHKPYRLVKKYNTVLVENKEIQIAGPTRGNVVPVIWQNKKYFISTNDLNYVR